MKRSSFLSLIAGLVLGFAVISRSDSASAVGDWKGTLNAGGVQLRLVFHVAKQANGTLKGTMDSLDQGVKGIPMTATATDNSVRFEIASINGTFEGKPDKGNLKLTGDWRQGPASLPLTLEKFDPVRSPNADARKATPESIEVNKQTGGKLIGKWNGTLNAGKELKLIFKISKTTEGGLVGSMDSVDQGASDIPISSISLAASKVRFELKTIGGTYEAALNKDGTGLTGQWQQGPNTFPLNLVKDK